MWFHSGRRRDLCAILYDAGELRAQTLKTRLEAHYETRINPQSFYGTLDALVSKGHLARRTEGIHDVYGLTERGEQAVEEHYEWLTRRVEAGRERPDETDEAGETDEETDEVDEETDEVDEETDETDGDEEPGVRGRGRPTG
jgi:DNA-binding PadR family transcriptional regulator